MTGTGGRAEGAGSGGDGPHVGHFVRWDGGCVLIGHAGGIVPVHAHYAMQIGFGAAPGIRFRASERDPWTEYVGAIIPSRQPHSMDATAAAPNAVVFVEPETREGRALAARHPTAGIAPVSQAELAGAGPALFAAWDDARRAQGSAAAVAAAARRVVRALTGGTETSVPSDERIVRAVDYVNAHLDAPLTLTAVASEACLSPSRFRHLFVEQTGTALRPYILWRRFLRVWELLMGGASLSTAAHAAHVRLPAVRGAVRRSAPIRAGRGRSGAGEPDREPGRRAGSAPAFKPRSIGGLTIGPTTTAGRDAKR